jgi:hypothetical protein
MPRRRKSTPSRRDPAFTSTIDADEIEVIKGLPSRPGTRPTSEATRKETEWAAPYDRVADLIGMLRRLPRGPVPIDDESPSRRIPLWLLEAVIEELEQRPDPRAIRGPAKLREAHALLMLRGRKQELMDKDENLSATDAEWQVAEEGVHLFHQFTGRTISPDRLRRLMQNAPRTDAKSPTSRR